MGLSSIFKSKAPPRKSADEAASAESVQQARTRARRRLVGAIVLVTVGVVGFPLLFETQPRPIPVDIPIDIPKKDNVPALVVPPAPPASQVARSPQIITETPAEAGREVEAPVSAARQAVVAVPPVASPAVPSAPGATPAASVPAPAAAAEPVKAKEGRFVVQVGAFADAAAAREMRGKAEKLGLKTYTQVTETTSGNRIRVRAGPFATREEADKALAKARAGGLSGVVLTL